MRIPAQLLRDEVAIARLVGHTGYGPQYEAPVIVPAHVEAGTQKVVTQGAAEIICDLVANLDPGANVRAADHVEWEGATYEVIQVTVVKVRGQLHHIEVAMRSVA